MKIFRVNIEKTLGIETLVMGKSVNEAKMLALMCVKNGELDFDDVLEEYTGISGVYAIDISDKIIKEIKDYGIIDRQAKLIYDPNTIEEIAELQKKLQKEEWLKKNHLEFNFL